MSSPTEERHKQQIAKSFGRAAISYHVYAGLQQNCAQHLLNLITTYQAKLPEGKILEIGCGTGFITQGLLQCFPRRLLEITDLSSEMIEFCQSQLIIPDPQKSFVSFQSIDAENLSDSTEFYAAIVGGFVIQWFHNPIQGLRRLLEALHPNGMLFISFPTCHSFPEWRQVCNHLNLPFTARPLPDPEILLSALPQAQLCYANVLDLSTTHANAADFFRSLKAIGAGVNPAQPPLPPKQMKTLLRHWDAQTAGPVQVHHQIACWALQRKSS
ncbi:methyltransferase domain-containing protein [Leptolyngbya sp. NK1-12]|uniref:Methyltransferase domain-containing protein n=1 Tax=Leptolyngbya sp. NK1-12 TaxID=2547451 RepID=A0AA96WNR5_9CYAN|nr:methyltransferase domain-containing protein [Leptolyngbya sp. NK1-12]